MSRKAIADRILQLLSNWQLSGSYLVGQTYDGAGAMAGKNNGAAHALNLKCCSIAEIRNTMDTADSICRFFSNSPKRQLAFERWIEQKLEGERRSKLKSIRKTRWVERHEAFEVFIDLFCIREVDRTKARRGASLQTQIHLQDQVGRKARSF